MPLLTQDNVDWLIKRMDEIEGHGSTPYIERVFQRREVFEALSADVLRNLRRFEPVYGDTHRSVVVLTKSTSPSKIGDIEFALVEIVPNRASKSRIYQTTLIKEALALKALAMEAA